MNWKGIDKGPKLTIVVQFIGWTFLFFVIIFVLKLLGFIIEF
jgi:hypothetical protein